MEDFTSLLDRGNALQMARGLLEGFGIGFWFGTRRVLRLKVLGVLCYTGLSVPLK